MPAIKRFFPILFFIVLVTSTGCASKNSPLNISPFSGPVEQVLDTSGQNRDRLIEFLDSYKDNPEKRQAAQFLVANLPPADRVSLSAEMLKENLEFAFLARSSTGWGHDVSWTDFLHYVLPHRVSQEQAVNWRKEFYNELLPLVSECTSMEEAVLAVNRWCYSKIGFKSTQRWDQNPLMSINRGWGRCEEAVILTVCALRTVGIPARQAMVPAWQHSNDNHTWTEVMVDGKWHYIESANPDYGLDYAWFTGSARKAPLVISYAYGQDLQTEHPVMGRPFGCTLINTTQRYAPVSKTEITVLDSNGTAVPDVRIYLSVFNYASFRPVAAAVSDQEGKAEVLLGPGSVLVSAARGNSSAYVGSVWIPGEHARRQDILLRLQPDNEPEGQIFFPFAYDDKLARTAPPSNSEGAKKDEFKAIREARLEKLKGMKKGAEIYSENSIPGLGEGGLNTPQLLLALNKCPTEHLPSLKKDLNSMAVADLVKMGAQELIGNAELADKARSEAEKSGLKYSDDIFKKYVLNQRIMYEQFRFWREELHVSFNFNHKSGLDGIIRKIGKHTANLIPVPRGPLGSSMDPLGVFQSRTASNESEAAVFAAAAMRAAGIPARFLDEQGWVEFYDGEKWQPFYPAHPEKTGNRNATDESKAYYGVWQAVKFNIAGFPAGQKPAQYFKDFSISKLNKRCFFSIIEKTIKGKNNEKENTWEISLPKGKYFLISAKRNANNEPRISVIKIKF